MIYFASDLHLGHTAIICMQHRPFENVEEMNAVLIRNWNSFVHKNDTVYILGDLCHHIKVEECNELIRQLKGHTILIRGNHDKDYDPDLFDDIFDFLKLKGRCQTTISLMHYPMVEWLKSRHGGICLHGHQHNGPEYNLQH